MVKYHSGKDEYQLIINGTYSNTLYIEGFNQMMKDPTLSYKFYWLEAIVNLIIFDYNEVKIDDVINEMIVNSWASVTEYHIHSSGFTPSGEIKDALEQCVTTLQFCSGLESNASKMEIGNAIKKYDNKLRDLKLQLTRNVPYRALSGFFKVCKEIPKWSSITELIDLMNRLDNSYFRLPYLFSNDIWIK